MSSIAYNPYLHNTTYPDYDAIIKRLLGPLNTQLDAQTGALGSSVGFQQNLARSNAGLSQSELDAAHKEALLRIYNPLQARGLGPSGEVHHQVSAENHLYKAQSQLAANQLLGALKSLQDQLTQQAISAAGQQSQGMINAQDYASQNYSPTAGTPPWMAAYTQLAQRGF